MNNIDEKALKSLLFEIFAAGFIAGSCSNDGLAAAYNKYWKDLMKVVTK